MTDPDATVAWSANLSPSLATNRKIEIGQNSAERIRTEFSGSERVVVVVRPHEE